jgi:hypothetical protein
VKRFGVTGAGSVRAAEAAEITQALHNLQQGDSNAAEKTLIGATMGLERGKTS